MKKIINWFRHGYENRTEWAGHRRKGYVPSLVSFGIGALATIFTGNIWGILIPFTFYIGVLVGYEIKQWDLSGLDKEKIKWWFENKCIDSVVDVVMGSYLYIVFITLLLIVRY